MSKWQLIETAPKDGTWILIYCDSGVEKVQWYEIAGDGQWERSPTAEYDNECGIDDPTHWMPLPEPPE